MVDTLSIALSRPVMARPQPSGWTIQTDSRRHGLELDAPTVKITTTARHDVTGLRIWGNDGIYQRVEFSLPRMLFSTNRNLLASQHQMTEAIQQADAVASRVLGEPLKGRVVRIDLCGQFIGAGSEWVAAFRFAKHPKIRKPNRDFNGETLYIKGSELEFCIYDKGLEAKLTRDKVVRLECRLKSARMIKQCFKKELMLSELQFDESYQVYRGLSLGLSPETILKSGRPINVSSILLQLEASGLHDIVDKLLNAMSRCTRSRTKKKMQTNQQRQAGINLHALLPQAGALPFARL